MAEQDLIQAARGVVEAFNTSDWEGCKAAMTSDCVYDEVATSRRRQGVGDIISCWQEWKEVSSSAGILRGVSVRRRGHEGHRLRGDYEARYTGLQEHY